MRSQALLLAIALSTVMENVKCGHFSISCSPLKAIKLASRVSFLKTEMIFPNSLMFNRVYTLGVYFSTIMLGLDCSYHMGKKIAPSKCQYLSPTKS